MKWNKTSADRRWSKQLVGDTNGKIIHFFMVLNDNDDGDNVMMMKTMLIIIIIIIYCYSHGRTFPRVTGDGWRVTGGG